MKLRASDIKGEIIKWVVRLAIIEMAAEQLGMPQFLHRTEATSG